MVEDFRNFRVKIATYFPQEETEFWNYSLFTRFSNYAQWTNPCSPISYILVVFKYYFSFVDPDSKIFSVVPDFVCSLITYSFLCSIICTPFHILECNSCWSYVQNTCFSAASFLKRSFTFSRYQHIEIYTHIKYKASNVYC